MTKTKFKNLILQILGWTFILDIPFFLLYVFCLLAFKAYHRHNPLEDSFELFMVHSFYSEYDDPIFQTVLDPDQDEKLDIEWIVNENELRAFQDPTMQIINHGGAFYAKSRDYYEHYWIHANYETFKDGEMEESNDGMHCGTGMFNELIESGDTIKYRWFYSIFDKISTPYYRNRDTEVNPYELIDQFFGDSTRIYWSLLTFSPPWSNYMPQVVESPSFMLYSDDLKNKWSRLVASKTGNPKAYFIWSHKRSELWWRLMERYVIKYNYRYDSVKKWFT
jgi:hypothetical protein